MARAVLAICAVALVCVGSSAGARAGALSSQQEVTITGAGGVQLACGFVLPTGTAPDGGWPGIVLFPSLGLTHDTYYETQASFAVDGFASVSCDERGTGSSGGSFDLAGPKDAADAQAIFDWLAARPGVSPTQIGAYGFGLGGAEVWNAAVAHVPFKAILPAFTWSSLGRALKPTGAVNARTLSAFTAQGPPTWNTPSGIAARSYSGHLSSLTIPTLIIQERQNSFWDLTQATTAYQQLAGPKRLLVSWAGGTPTAPIIAWFRRYLANGDRVGGGVQIQHESPDAAIAKFQRLPLTRSVSLAFPGSTLKRSAWLTGGPLETWGGGNVTIRYTGASWTQVVATVSTAKGQVVTEGAAPVKQANGVLKIPLLNEVMLLPRGKKLTVTLSNHDTTFGGTTTGHIAVQRVTLNLSVLERAVSR